MAIFEDTTIETKNWIIIRPKGSIVFGFVQERENDSIGMEAKENMFYNNLMVVEVSNEQYSRLQIDKTTAGLVKSELTSKGYTPY